METLPALANARVLTIGQKKEWGEIITGWETKNRYVVSDADGQPLMYAGETGEGFMALLTRSFLKSKRPFTVEVRDAAGNPTLSVVRPWTWFFSRADILDGQGRKVGGIQQRWAWFRRRYDLLDGNGSSIANLNGPFFKPWTFHVLQGEREVGKISKKWSGLLKEAFTDADNFGVEFGMEMDADLRLLVVGATFLVDFVHFERTSN